MTEAIKFNEGLQNLHSDKMAELKRLLPNLFDKDGNLIKSELENFATGYMVEKQEPFCFSWAGKQKAKGLAFRQSETKLALKFDEKRSKNFDTTENLIIEGDNLHVLKLLVPSYKGKVKCIYIDPPYNTQNEFIYPDNYASSEIDYLVESGQLEEGQDVSGQSQKEKNTGRKHSNWLSFMYPRLVLARELLREDGVIFISIDDNEVHHLRQIMNEIFGEDNGLDRGSLIWVNKGSTKGFNKIVKNHEYILAYGKDAELIESVYGENNKDDLSELEHYCFNKPSEKNPLSQITFPSGLKIHGIENVEFCDYVGLEVRLRIVSGKMKFMNGQLVDDVVLEGTFPYVNQIKQFFINSKQNIPTLDVKGQEWLEIFFNKNGLPRYRKARNNMIISSIVDEKNIPNYGANEIKELFENKDIFSFSKPKELIKHILQYFTTNNDLILDFFAGSGTTGQAVMELNQEELDKQAKDGLLADKTEIVGGRKFILVQLPEKTPEKSEAFKAGYKHISDITIERVRRAGEKYKSVDNGFTVLQVTESAINRKFMNSINATKEEIFAEIALQFGYGLNFAIQKLFDGVFKLTGNEKSAIVIMGNEQLTNEMQKQIIGMSYELKKCQIFAQDACLNVEIIHNLYQHFEQKRVVIL